MVKKHKRVLLTHWSVFHRTHTFPVSELLQLVFDDREPVIKMIMKWDWLFYRVNLDPGIQIKGVNINQKIDDVPHQQQLVCVSFFFAKPRRQKVEEA